MYQLLTAMFLNYMLLIAFFSLVTRPLHFAGPYNCNFWTWKRWMQVGYTTIAAITVMQFSLVLPDGLRLDLHVVPIILAGLFGGPLGGSLAGAIAGAYGYLLGGPAPFLLRLGTFIHGLTAGLFSEFILRGKIETLSPWRLLWPVGLSTAIQFLLLFFFLDGAAAWKLASKLWVKDLLFVPAGAVIVLILLQDSKIIYRYHRQLEKMAASDPLTGLPNYRHLIKQLEQYIEWAAQNHRPLTFLIIDMDNFKEINDNYGHQVGDQVIKAFGNYLTSRVRPSDLVGRYAGDEFVIILPDCHLPEAIKIAERLRNDLKAEKLSLPDDKFLPLTISIGISAFPVHGRKAQELIGRADRALYEAKNKGGDAIALARYPANEKGPGATPGP